MSVTKEKTLIAKGLAAIAKGDARELKKSIKEALLSKVRRKLEQKEKEIAKSYLDDISSKKQ